MSKNSGFSVFNVVSVVVAVVALTFVHVAAEMKDCYIHLQSVKNKQIFAWRGVDYSDSFDGSWGACRYWDADVSFLLVIFDHYGGYDAGVARYRPPREVRGVLFDTTWRNQYMQAKYTVTDISSDRERYWGHYYMGPKTVITSTSVYETLDYNYECYIIENSSRSVAEFKQWVVDGGGWEVGYSYHNGETYSHFRRDLGKIFQIFSIRETWRPSGGRTDVNQIAKLWLDLGMIQSVHSKYYVLGWKHNVETEGRLKGSVKFSELSFV